MKKFYKLVTFFLSLAMVIGFISCKPEVEYVDKTYAAAPTFTITQNKNGSFSVAIASATEGATIYYSKDINVLPSTEYKNVIEGIKTDAYFSAIARKDGIEDSPVSYAKISVKEKITTEYVSLEGYVLAPTFTTTANAAGTNITVTMTSATEGAKIYYTTDGKAPTTGSTLYNSAVTIDQTTSFKAIAIKEGLENSPVSTATVSLTTSEVEVEVEKEVYISSDQTNSAVNSIKIYRQTIDGENYELVSTETASIAKDTAFSDIVADYEYEGFTARAMAQTGAALSLFYERNLITLTFLINSGDTQAYATKTGLYGSAVESVTDPTTTNKAGYHFNYWTTTGVTQVSVAQTFPAANVTYIANWHEIEHFDVTYISDYGTAPAAKQIDCHTPLTNEYLPDLGSVNIQSGGKRYFRYWKNSSGEQVTAGTQISEDLELTAEWSDVNFIGQKVKPDAVGDIVFSDGSATPYAQDLSLTAGQKQEAVAVIFYKGTSTDVLGEKMLGVGIHNSQDEEQTELKWAFKPDPGVLDSSAQGNDHKFVNLICTVTFNEGFIMGLANNVLEASFSGTIDGSNSWTTLCEDVTDYTNPSRYPAWTWVNNYAETYELTGDFTSGWYFPSIAELSMLCIAVKDTNSVINEALSCANGTPVADKTYWSSSQASYDGSNPQMAMCVNFTESKIDGGFKYGGRSVLAIRAFE